MASTTGRIVVDTPAAEAQPSVRPFPLESGHIIFSLSQLTFGRNQKRPGDLEDHKEPKSQRTARVLA